MTKTKKGLLLVLASVALFLACYIVFRQPHIPSWLMLLLLLVVVAAFACMALGITLITSGIAGKERSELIVKPIVIVVVLGFLVAPVAAVDISEFKNLPVNDHISSWSGLVTPLIMISSILVTIFIFQSSLKTQQKLFKEQIAAENRYKVMPFLILEAEEIVMPDPTYRTLALKFEYISEYPPVSLEWIACYDQGTQQSRILFSTFNTTRGKVYSFEMGQAKTDHAPSSLMAKFKDILGNSYVQTVALQWHKSEKTFESMDMSPPRLVKTYDEPDNEQPHP